MRPARSPIVRPRLSVVAESSSIALVISTGSMRFSCSHIRSYCCANAEDHRHAVVFDQQLEEVQERLVGAVEQPPEAVLLLLRGEVGSEEEQRELAVLRQRVGELPELLAQDVELALLERDLEQRARVDAGELVHQFWRGPEEESPERSSSFERLLDQAPLIVVCRASLRVTFSVAMHR